MVARCSLIELATLADNDIAETIDQRSSRSPEFILDPEWGWELYATSLDDDPNFMGERLGYLGKAYINHAKEIIVINHRGTMLAGHTIEGDHFAVSTAGPSSNLSADTRIWQQRIPTETSIAADFVSTVCEKRDVEFQDYQVIQIGHSLGGFHAQVCGYFFEHEVCSFDNPGAATVVRKAIPGELDIDAVMDRSHTILSMPNMINFTGNHFGNVHRLTRGIDDEGVWARSTNTVRAHRLTFLVPQIVEAGSADVTLEPELEIPGFTNISRTFIRPPIFVDQVTQSFESSLSGTYRVYPYLWCISHINLGSVLTGHSMLVVEGVVEGNDNYEPVVYYIHLTYSSENQPDDEELTLDNLLMRQQYLCDGFARVRMMESQNHYLDSYYNSRQACSWHVSDNLAIEMVDHIQQNECGRWIPYNIIQWHWSGNETHNCTTWAIDMLENHAKIDNAQVHAHIIVKPGVSTLPVGNSPAGSSSGFPLRPSIRCNCTIL